MKRNKVLLCLLAVLLMLLPERALAAGSIDLAKDVSLTVTAFYDQKAVSGMRFDAYLIANCTISKTDARRNTEEILAAGFLHDTCFQRAAHYAIQTRIFRVFRIMAHAISYRAGNEQVAVHTLLAR